MPQCVRNETHLFSLGLRRQLKGVKPGPRVQQIEASARLVRYAARRVLNGPIKLIRPELILQVPDAGFTLFDIGGDLLIEPLQIEPTLVVGVCHQSLEVGSGGGL
jgi:hypothetical protein